MGLPLLGLIGDGIKAVGGILDDLTTTDEERLKAKKGLAIVEKEMAANVMMYEAEIVKQQASIIRAEAGSKSWLTNSWRPIVMLVFTALVVAYWMGFSSKDMSEAEVLSVFSLIKLGLGGYVIGRSAEKIVPAAIGALKKKEEA